MHVVNRQLLVRARQLLLMLGLALALKQFYSAANAAQLQWILYPLVLLLECFSDLCFEATADFEWRDDEHRVAIVKACAGINFLIISLMTYLWQRRERAPSLRLLLRALLSAWLTALCANALRILLCVYCQDALAKHTGLSVEESHRIIGITVYFSCLWVQLSAFRFENFSRKAFTAMLLYSSVTLLMPWIRASLLGNELPDGKHAVWVLGLPATMIALSLILVIIKSNRRRITPKYRSI